MRNKKTENRREKEMKSEQNILWILRTSIFFVLCVKMGWFKHIGKAIAAGIVGFEVNDIVKGSNQENKVADHRFDDREQ